MLVFRKYYFLLTIILSIVEVLIAVFVDDRFVRPILGDFLVVILLYCFIRSFFNVPIIKTAVGVLIFAIIVEITQYFNLIVYLGLRDSKVARAFLGGSFDWQDMVAYTLGIITVLITEKLSRRSVNDR